MSSINRRVVFIVIEAKKNPGLATGTFKQNEKPTL